MRAAFVLAGLIAGSLYADDPKPLELKAAVGKFSRVNLGLDGDAFRYAFVSVNGYADADRSYDPDPKKFILKVISLQPDTAYVVVYGLKGTALTDPIVYRITFGDGQPGPGPGPGPNPPPLPPDDPLVARLKTALRTGGFAGKALAMAKGFEASAGLVEGANTFADLRDASKVALKAAVGSDVVVPAVVKEVIGPELNAILPGDRMDDGMTKDERERAKALFLRLAKALRAAAVATGRAAEPEGTPRPLPRGQVIEE